MRKVSDADIRRQVIRIDARSEHSSEHGANNEIGFTGWRLALAGFGIGLLKVSINKLPETTVSGNKCRR